MSVKVSVILPNYNHALYLTERIESILKQTYQNFELILLDDKSSDNSLGVLKSYESHPKVSHVDYNVTNSGSTFQQWSKGLNYCQGEYIWIAESDDIAHPNFLFHLVNMLDSDKTLAFAYSQSHEINEKSEIIGSYFRHTEDLNAQLWKNDFILSGSDFVINYLTKKNCIPNVSAVLFRKAHFFVTEHVKSYRYLGDWLLYVQLLENKKIGYIADSLNYFRTHNNTTRSGKTLDDWLYTKEEFVGVYNEISRIFNLSQNECDQLTHNISLLIDNIVTIIPTIRKACCANQNTIAIYASGALGVFALKIIRETFSYDEVKVLCFIDKKAQDNDYKLDDIPVVSLARFKNTMPRVPIFIASISYYNEIIDELRCQKLEHLVLLPAKAK